jgi:hypothetical protein
MSKTFAYFISLAVFLTFLQSQANAQDTLTIPLKIKAGIEVSGPAIYYSNKNLKNLEAFVSYDLDEKRAVSFSLGSLNYEYSQYNYSYTNNGVFMRLGMDFNLLKPEKAMGKYWAGVGLKYGLSMFNSTTPELSTENYWGVTNASVPTKTSWGHFVEVDPGIRTEMFRNFSMGWTINLRLLVHAGGSKDLRPIYLPGFGNATKTISTGISYFLVWNIPFKKITVITKKEEPEETDEDQNGTNNNTNGSNGNSGNTGNSGIRQQNPIQH